MVAYLSYPPDAITNLYYSTTTNKNHPILPSPSSSSRRRRRRFDSREALFLIRECNSFKQLKQIHAQVLRNGLLHHHSNNQLLLTQMLLRLCPSTASSQSNHFNHPDYATSLLLSTPTTNPTAFNWNLVIRSHTVNHNGTTVSPYRALLLYSLMIQRSVPHDHFTFPFVIKACTLVGSSLALGKAIHARALINGFYADTFVQNTLMDMYFKHGDSVSGRMVFDKMTDRTVVSWTTMLVGLVDAEAIEDARGVFDRMPERNVVSWTAMISGYARNGQPREAFRLYRCMVDDRVRPNEYTLVNLLVACTEMGSLEMGSSIHDLALKKGFGLGVFLGTALIDMYSKCGSLEDARKVFYEMPRRSLATWNSMITSLGVHGQGYEALSLFKTMEKEAATDNTIQPDAITFVGVLCACLQEGLVGEGCRYFRYMRDRYGITPIVDHYVCMVALLSQAGMLNEAYQLATIMPAKPNSHVWEALLRAVRAYGNVDLEQVVSKHIEDAEPTRDDTILYDKSHLLNRDSSFKWEVG
ncbi:hypothetical protein MKW94_028912 [Papaver nudicaule]|uniref:Pentatricopeptide repeat-containing protein n=1 Tax=Papaver nudicaule TaxID=74823 RepID=A0AA41RX83_PAPNU|nr:hypothetical protein [Papaver nudicaule]